MPNYVFSMLTAPQVCLHTLALKFVEAVASLLTLVSAPDSSLWNESAGLTAASLSLEQGVFHLQSQWQEGTLYLAGFGGIPLIAAAVAFLVMGLHFGARKRSEEALRESELSYRLLFESGPYPAWVFDAETLSFLTVNEAAVRFYGYSREEFLRMTIRDIRPPEDVPKLLGRLMENGTRQSLNEVWRHRRKDGTIVYTEITACELSYHSSRAVMVFAHDVSERVRAELALRDNESRFRRLIEEVHVGIVLSGPGGECFLANERAHRLLGLTAEQLAGRTPADPAWNIIRSDGTHFPCEERPLMRAIATRRPVRNVVMGYYREAMQDRVWLLVDAEPHLADDGSVSQVVSTLTDVTEWKRAEDSLRQSEERNRAMLKAIPDIVLLMTKEGVYLDYHVKNLSDLPIHPSDFLGKNVRAVLPPEVAEDFISYFDRTILLGETQVYEFTFRGRIFETRIVRCEDNKILIIARDVTAHKRADAQRTLLLRRLVNAEVEERARLAREVHDEFSSYLTALKWGLESLGRAEAGSTPVESNLSYLLDLTTRLQQKVRDFAFELSPAELDDKGGLPAALDQYVRRWAELAGGRLEAEFRAEGFDAGPARLPREVELALYRVAQEALTNVLKHAGARHIAVTLSFDAAEPGRGVVCLSVKDDGVGFVPAHEEAAERGLGLKGIGERAALVGGALEVNSGSDGTRLTVSVPFATPHREERGDERTAYTDRR